MGWKTGVPSVEKALEILCVKKRNQNNSVAYLVCYPTSTSRNSAISLRLYQELLKTSKSSVSQPPGRGPVPGPGINYTGPREVLLEFAILVF